MGKGSDWEVEREGHCTPSPLDRCTTHRLKNTLVGVVVGLILLSILLSLRNTVEFEATHTCILDKYILVLGN